MSMPTRSRTGSGPLLAVAIIGVVVLATIGILALTGATPQSVWDSFFPVHNQTPATDRGVATKGLYDIVFYIAAAIFLIVELLIVYTVFRYRRKPGDESLPPQTHGNNLVEVIWTAIPTAIVLFLFVLSWQTLQTVDAKTPSQVHIRAEAAQFQWQFAYLDENGEELFKQALPQGEDGGMVVPVGEAVQVSLRSPDVIHAFYVPKFLFKRDVVPGKVNTFDFTVEEAGTYRGQCAELCGTYHGSMIFEVRALPPADFDAWFAAQIEKANATPAPVPSGDAGGVRVEEAAKDVQFVTQQLTAPKDVAFILHFKNDDPAGVPHNIEIKDAAGAVVFKGDIIDGGAEIDYQVPPLAAGSYPFVCTVHPNMTGTITVQ